MAENPLLPNARLRELYKLMQRAAALRRRAPGPALDAVLAATLVQLEDDDFVLPLDGSPALALLAELDFDAETPQPQRDTLLLAAGAALALREAGSERFALVFARDTAQWSRTEPGWADALRYACSANLPLLLVCVAETVQPPQAQNAFTWAAVTRLARPLGLPVMPIDGADAVAVYRTLQESILRARHGGGPAVLWCVMPDAATKGPAPLARLRKYLADRGLAHLTG